MRMDEPAPPPPCPPMGLTFFVESPSIDSRTTGLAVLPENSIPFFLERCKGLFSRNKKARGSHWRNREPKSGTRPSAPGQIGRRWCMAFSAWRPAGTPGCRWTSSRTSPPPRTTCCAWRNGSPPWSSPPSTSGTSCWTRCPRCS